MAEYIQYDVDRQMVYAAGVADTAVDDELAEIERKLALVRAGELHEYDQVSNDSDAPDVVDERTEPAADESAVTNEPDILMDDADMESTDVAMESGPVPEDVPAAKLREPACRVV